MGAKKKGGAAKKGGKGDEEEDLSVDNFMKFYKRKLTEFKCDKSKTVMEKFDEYLEEGAPIAQVPQRLKICLLVSPL